MTSLDHLCAIRNAIDSEIAAEQKRPATLPPCPLARDAAPQATASERSRPTFEAGDHVCFKTAPDTEMIIGALTPDGKYANVLWFDFQSGAIFRDVLPSLCLEFFTGDEINE